ncbi:MAG TPA: tRNA pseudouridine(13) synthase TruD [Planctomycetota bacterium]|nr:tRNA pseudouridine(13) synthase TruD [Planctomycetota bacterium]
MIKHTPDDFQVEEILGSELQLLPTGPFALYRLEKQTLATPEAIGKIARELQVPSGSFAYAGLKDKHASTRQHVTLKLEDGREAPEKLAGKGWSLERLGFTERSITASDIQRNRFRIQMRNLSQQDSYDLEKAVKLLSVKPNPESFAAVSEVRIVNYFGDQRFGSARHGRGFIARNLIKGDFEGALKLAIATESRKDRMEQKTFKRTLRENWGKWKEVFPKLRPMPERKAVERLVNSGGDFRAAFCALPYLLQQLSVYAYQSWLWNRIARRLIEQFCVPRGNVLAADDPFGEMLFPCTEAVAPELLSLNLPLLARKTVLAEPWKAAAEDVLKEEGITVDELEIPGVRRPFFGEEPRALFFIATDFVLSRGERDESAGDPKRQKRTVSFALPRGCYATVVLRAMGQ